MDANEYLIINVILYLFIVIAGIRFTSYIKKKGEHDATKEDIDQITKSVEEVKSQFSMNLEQFKSNLDLVTTQRLSLATEKRNAIYSFNDEYYRWYNTAIDLARTGFEKDDMKLFADNLIKVKMSYAIASNRIEIFYNDDDFIKLKKSIEIKTQKLSDLNAECFLKCHNLLHEVKMNELFDPSTPFDNTYIRLAENQIALIDEYGSLQKVTFDVLEPDLIAMRNILGQYIANIF